MNSGNNATATRPEVSGADSWEAAWGNVHSINRAERGAETVLPAVAGCGDDIASFQPRRRRAEYRIVRDRHCGYEVQYRRRIVWFRTPWLQCGLAGGMGTNSHPTVEEARAFARAHASAGCVEYLGFL